MAFRKNSPKKRIRDGRAKIIAHANQIQKIAAVLPTVSDYEKIELKLVVEQMDLLSERQRKYLRSLTRGDHKFDIDFEAWMICNPFRFLYEQIYRRRATLTILFDGKAGPYVRFVLAILSHCGLKQLLPSSVKSIFFRDNWSESISSVGERALPVLISRIHTEGS